MSTRSHIGITAGEGKCHYIYCNYDGYPSHNGLILQDHYTDEKKVKALMKLGSISGLAEEVGEKHEPKNEDGTLNKAYEKWTSAYRRDYEQDDAEGMQRTTVEAFWRRVKNDIMIEWVYLFDTATQKWWVMGQEDKKPRLLSRHPELVAERKRLAEEDAKKPKQEPMNQYAPQGKKQHTIQQVLGAVRMKLEWLDAQKKHAPLSQKMCGEHIALFMVSEFILGNPPGEHYFSSPSA